MAKKRTKNRTNWKRMAEELERENGNLRHEIIALERTAQAIRVLSDVVLDAIRDEVRDMVTEEVQSLDIHVS